MDQTVSAMATNSYWQAWNTVLNHVISSRCRVQVSIYPETIKKGVALTSSASGQRHSFRDFLIRIFGTALLFKLLIMNLLFATPSLL